MKITHVRISLLESGPGYNNSSCTLEAALEDGEDYAAVANELRTMCKSQIKGAKEIERLYESVNSLAEQEKDLARLNAALHAKIEANRKIIREHDELGEIAKREGFDVPLTWDELPF